MISSSTATKSHPANSFQREIFSPVRIASTCLCRRPSCFCVFDTLYTVSEITGATSSNCTRSDDALFLSTALVPLSFFLQHQTVSANFQRNASRTVPSFLFRPICFSSSFLLLFHVHRRFFRFVLFSPSLSLAPTPDGPSTRRSNSIESSYPAIRNKRCAMLDNYLAISHVSTIRPVD